MQNHKQILMNQSQTIRFFVINTIVFVAFGDDSSSILIVFRLNSDYFWYLTSNFLSPQTCYFGGSKQASNTPQ